MMTNFELMRKINTLAADLEGTIRSFGIENEFITVGGNEYALSDFVNIAVIHHSDINQDVYLSEDYAFHKLNRKLFGNEKHTPLFILHIMRAVMNKIMRTYA